MKTYFRDEKNKLQRFVLEEESIMYYGLYESIYLNGKGFSIIAIETDNEKDMRIIRLKQVSPVEFSVKLKPVDDIIFK